MIDVGREGGTDGGREGVMDRRRAGGIDQWREVGRKEPTFASTVHLAHRAILPVLQKYLISFKRGRNISPGRRTLRVLFWPYLSVMIEP